ncbi:MAG: hypothetical protein IJQ58_08530 [Synergistaceae bacterium]|nr:hypothetical protein [Synergistaceae bacterium]
MMENEYDMTLGGTESETDSVPLIYVGHSDMKRGLKHNAVYIPPLPEWLQALCDEDPYVKENVLTVKEYAQGVKA